MKQEHDEKLRIQEKTHREEYLMTKIGLVPDETRKGEDEGVSSKEGGEGNAHDSADQEDYDKEAEYAESDRREWERQKEIGKPTQLRRIWYNDSEDSDDSERRNRRVQHNKQKQMRGGVGAERRRETKEVGRKAVQAEPI